jgi:putative PEP-CTERM system histidine kinase
MTTGLVMSVVAVCWILGLCWVVSRQRSHPLTKVGFVGTLLMLGAEGLIAHSALLRHDQSHVLKLQGFRCLLLSFAPVLWLLYSLTYARGNVREGLLRWRLALGLAAALPLLAIAGFRDVVIMDPGHGSQGGPFVIIGWPLKLVHLLLMVAAVLALMNLERTFRTAVGTMRWKLKYGVMGFGGLLAVRLFTSSQAILYSALHPLWHSLNTGALLVACSFLSVAVHRTDGLGMDIYPSKSTLYSSITVVLAGVYLFVVGVLGKIANAFGGDGSLPLKSFLVLGALSACAAFILSDRLRLLTKQLVSRHFQRPFYDYRKVWQAFTDRTSSCRDQTTLSREIVRLICSTVEALSVNLWVLDVQEGSIRLGASTSLSDEEGGALVQSSTDVSALARRLREFNGPVHFAKMPADVATALSRMNPRQFDVAGDQLCVPLIANDVVLGFMVVGDRVGGVRFSVEDLDLLKCISDQAAGNLLNLRLGDQLIRAKELAAFQQMAAFFVHDLKNTASSLSLMLQNLPTQFDNPAFRSDALRVVSKAVGRVRELIDRLTSLRQDMDMKFRDADLNEAVETALQSIAPIEKPWLRCQLQRALTCWMDPDQIQKVVVNLVLNAKEALGEKGEVRVETELREGWSVLSVRDTGCGMAPEFIRNSLFRPFQTTKRQGMGIGMFHCKTIVDAHRGRIEVASVLGHGTQFQVWLPAK